MAALSPDLGGIADGTGGREFARVFCGTEHLSRFVFSIDCAHSSAIKQKISLSSAHNGWRMQTETPTHFSSRSARPALAMRLNVVEEVFCASVKHVMQFT